MTANVDYEYVLLCLLSVCYLRVLFCFGGPKTTHNSILRNDDTHVHIFISVLQDIVLF